MATYVIVHGAWHEGALFEEVAAPIRVAGHTVHLPTLAGNEAGGNKRAGLDDAIASVTDYFAEHDLTDAVLVGHSYGGMVITGAYDRLPEGSVRRLVYWSAFVPNDGEALDDLVPPHYVDLFNQLEADDGSVLLPFPVWREAFINDASLEQAQEAYDKLNPHPHKTFQDKISLRSNPAEWQVGKSYIHCQEDVALPASLPWHPRLSEKLGLYRYVWMPGSHEVCFTNPALLAQKFMEAGRD
ncbi:alpha/beta fold hydrolase [Vannielia litorea]|uniref:alpha/beta fold hydrolase n=1 Tax=Vannielia litorea TaxID=1217970 RepID=UPI001C94AC16|nr:alpha/beta hydrolase [Vannielia litorea]MBY6048947.1 alpha/beta hydrolase [Vannielia litorea]MBY6076361.1 alpha/beta hydrolase [Vannielia litorea]